MRTTMDKYLINLIDRMNDISDRKMEAGYESSKTIAWKAYREAEKLAEAEYLLQLMEFIDEEKDKKKRDKAYFILGHIAKNLNDHSVAQYLINRTENETDKYIVGSLFDRIKDLYKPIGTELKPIIDATKSDKWLIRYSAIQALQNSESRIAESTLISILENSEDPNDLIYSNAILNRIGTSEAIPAIEKHLKSRKRDVKLSAKLAIEEIRNRS